MRRTLYQIDAFADRLFAGNRTAIVPLDQWPLAVSRQGDRLAQ